MTWFSLWELTLSNMVTLFYLRGILRGIQWGLPPLPALGFRHHFNLCSSHVGSYSIFYLLLWPGVKTVLEPTAWLFSQQCLLSHRPRSLYGGSSNYQVCPLQLNNEQSRKWPQGRFIDLVDLLWVRPTKGSIYDLALIGPTLTGAMMSLQTSKYQYHLQTLCLMVLKAVGTPSFLVYGYLNQWP